jgi:O-methyltransferase
MIGTDLPAKGARFLARGARSVARTPDIARALAVSGRYREYTMIDQQHYFENLLLAHRWAPPGGEVVECGVWRGGMSRGLADMLGPDRKYHLFDSFEGLPPAQELDGQEAIDWQAEQRDESSPEYFGNCSAEESFARKLFEGSGLDVEFHRGWFEDTIPKYQPERPISVLRLDGDWYESTMTCLRALVPHLAPKAVILVDDYYSWDGCARAIHDYLAETKSTMRIQQGWFGTCYMINA